MAIVENSTRVIVDSGVQYGHPDFVKMKQEVHQFLLAGDLAHAFDAASHMLHDSNAFAAIHAIGLCLVEADVDEAFKWLNAAVSLFDADVNTYVNSATVMIDHENYVKARHFLNHAKDQNHPKLNYLRGMCACHLTEFELAISYFKASLTVDPDYTAAKMMLAFTYGLSDQYDEAFAVYQSILNSGELHDEVVNNTSSLLRSVGRWHEALDFLETRCHKPDWPVTLYNKSMLLLGLGRWTEGWQLYNYRYDRTVRTNNCFDPSKPVVYKLEELTNKRVLLMHELGLGDSIQYIRYAKTIQSYASELILSVPAEMMRIAKLMGFERIISYGMMAQVDHDVILPMMSISALLQEGPEDVTGEPYLPELPRDIIQLRSIDQSCRPGKPRIGLCWSGASRTDDICMYALDKRRSIPFSELKPLFGFVDCDFVSLQQPNQIVEDEWLVQPIQWDWDVLDTCGLISQLDLVITVDTAVAHMAGAMGKPVWMLSRYDICWRWGWVKPVNWYDSMRIFRQDSPGDWKGVIQKVMDSLYERYAKAAR